MPLSLYVTYCGAEPIILVEARRGDMKTLYDSEAEIDNNVYDILGANSMAVEDLPVSFYQTFYWNIDQKRKRKKLEEN